MNGVNAEKFCKRWRHIPGANHSLSIGAPIKIWPPENARHSVRVIKAVGMMQLAVLVHVVVSSELRSNDDGGVAGKIWVPLYPVEDIADCEVRCLHRIQIFFVALVTDVGPGFPANDDSRSMLL